MTNGNISLNNSNKLYLDKNNNKKLDENDIQIDCKNLSDNEIIELVMKNLEQNKGLLLKTPDGRVFHIEPKNENSFKNTVTINGITFRNWEKNGLNINSLLTFTKEIENFNNSMKKYDKTVLTDISFEASSLGGSMVMGKSMMNVNVIKNNKGDRRNDQEIISIIVHELAHILYNNQIEVTDRLGNKAADNAMIQNLGLDFKKDSTNSNIGAPSDPYEGVTHRTKQQYLDNPNNRDSKWRLLFVSAMHTGAYHDIDESNGYEQGVEPDEGHPYDNHEELFASTTNAFKTNPQLFLNRIDNATGAKKLVLKMLWFEMRNIFKLPLGFDDPYKNETTESIENTKEYKQMYNKCISSKEPVEIQNPKDVGY